LNSRVLKLGKKQENKRWEEKKNTQKDEEEREEVGTDREEGGFGSDP
jgi:hypothetical protein